MKTDLVDVNDTRKNLRVEIPSDVVDAEIDRVARDYSRKARDSRVPPGQGAGARHQAAIQGSDPARRRARPDSARGRRCAAGARRRAGRHAGHPRRDGRGRSAADLHGVVRHGAVVRAGRLRDDHAAPAVDPASTTRRSTRRCSGCAIARRGSNRSKAAASITATRSRSISSGPSSARLRERRAKTDAGGARTDKHENVTVELGAKANPPGFDEQLLGLEVGATQDVHRSTTRPTTRLAELADTDVSYTVDVKAHQAARAAGARRRVREGSGRVRDARRAARARARGSRARGAATRPSARCAPS